MKLCILISAAAAYVGISIAMTTMQPDWTTTEEPKEVHRYRFIYDGISHHLLLLIVNHHRTKCYIQRLSQDEQKIAHNATGLRQLEIKLVDLIDTGVTTIVSKHILSAHIRHLCDTNSTTHMYYSIQGQSTNPIVG